MNKKQLVAALVGGGLLALNALFPPMTDPYSRGSRCFFTTRHVERGTTTAIDQHGFKSTVPRRADVTVNTSRLLVTSVLLMGVTLMGIAAAGLLEKPRPSAEGSQRAEGRAEP